MTSKVQEMTMKAREMITKTTMEVSILAILEVFIQVTAEVPTMEDSILAMEVQTVEDSILAMEVQTLEDSILAMEVRTLEDSILAMEVRTMEVSTQATEVLTMEASIPVIAVRVLTILEAPAGLTTTEALVMATIMDALRLEERMSGATVAFYRHSCFYTQPLYYGNE